MSTVSHRQSPKVQKWSGQGNVLHSQDMKSDKWEKVKVKVEDESGRLRPVPWK
jgi:hypothetical protein